MIGAKVGLLDLAWQLGTVAQACRVLGWPGQRLCQRTATETCSRMGFAEPCDRRIALAAGDGVARRGPGVA